MKLIDAPAAARIESHLSRVLDRHLDAPGLAPMRTMIRDYVMAGGKRVRPQLTVWTHAMATGATDASTTAGPVLDVAAGWELFHAFLLVHDDIIDESATRREQAALHHQLASLDGNSLRFGTNLGIVAGDLLFSAAMCLWHELEIEDAATHRDLLKLFGRVACTTGFGQAIDICVSHLPMSEVDRATLLREYHWKTAAYTFEGPMLSGAILAGLGDAPRRAISAYALALGQAYQLQNDLHDLATPAHAGCDLVQGKRTLALFQHRDALDDAGRDALDARLTAIAAASGGAVDLAESLRGELIRGDAVGRSRETIATLLAEARAAARDPSLPTMLGAGMADLLDTLGERYFAASRG